MFGAIGLAINALLALLTYKMSLSRKNNVAMIIQIVLLAVILVGSISIMMYA